MKELVSIIIRTKDEERWITKCLQNVFDQISSGFDIREFGFVIWDHPNVDY